MGEAEKEMERAGTRVSGALLRVRVCPGGLGSAWSQCAGQSAGSPENTREEGEKREKDWMQLEPSTPATERL